MEIQSEIGGRYIERRKTYRDRHMVKTDRLDRMGYSEKKRQEDEV